MDQQSTDNHTTEGSEPAPPQANNVGDYIDLPFYKEFQAAQNLFCK